MNKHEDTISYDVYELDLYDLRQKKVKDRKGK